MGKSILLEKNARKIADIASITTNNLSHGAIGTVITKDLKILRSSVE